MEFEKHLDSLTSTFVILDKDPDQKRTARQNVEVFLNVIKTADTNLIACKAIISKNYASDFTGTCSHLSDQVSWLNGGVHLET